jgi:adenylate cyclase
MGADEEGTHERLKAHLGELVEPKIGEHRGRTVKNTGDGLLAEFASVVDAVRCAVDVQRGMIDRESEMPEERRIRFRIGVNLGDVIAEEHDIFGDGVNVAARLEALAEPGGICISRVVRDQIRDKLPYPFEDRGEQTVKNIARPVRVFNLRPESIAELPMADAPISVPRGRRSNVAPVVAAVTALLVIAAVGWWVWPAARTSFPPATAVATDATFLVPQPRIAPRLSIVVLPFANLSNNPEKQYLADGITEDVTTDLSRIADMLVISRNTAFTFKDKPVRVQQIGRELGVRYVLEGSVQRSSNQVRVNAQLIDAETNAHVWAERFDRGMGDLFALQNDITHRIAFALNVELIAKEAARPTDHPDVLEFIFRGRAARLKPNSRSVHAEAIGLFERALALDAGSVEAQSWLALTLANRVMDHLTETEAADIARAEDLVRQALAASPRRALVHFAKGEMLRAQNRWEEAIPEYQTVLAFNRNSATALHSLAGCKLFSGSIEEVIPLEEQAIRLSPLDAQNGARYGRIGLVHLLQSRTDEAIPPLERARSINPEVPGVHALLASSYALNGDSVRAAAELAETRRLIGNDRYSTIARLRAVGYWGVPKIRALYEATYFTGLRKAGMPEE